MDKEILIEDNSNTGYIHQGKRDTILKASWFMQSGTTEIHITGHASMTGDFQKEATTLINALQNFLKEFNSGESSTVFVRYFVSDWTNQSVLVDDLKEKTTDLLGQCAISIIEQPPLHGGKLAVWLYAINDPTSTSKKEHTGHSIILKRNSREHIWTAALTAPAREKSSGQTDAIFSEYASFLTARDCKVKDNCIRTWLYVRDIDVNYHGAVVSRREFFDKLEMTSKTHFIASTGIEGRHAEAPVKIIMDAAAIKGIAPDQVHYLQALDNLNPTHEYGVTFERGTAIDFGDRRHIYISGTASIDYKGDILYPLDPVRQVERVIDNIAALLADADATMKNVMQMLVYLRDPSDLPVINEYLEQNYNDIPKVIVHGPVCRPGWLVEIECIAIKEINRPELLLF